LAGFRTIDEALAVYTHAFINRQLIIVTPLVELIGPPGGAVYVGTGSSDEAHPDDAHDGAIQHNETQDGCIALSEEPEVADPWDFSASELAALATLDATFDIFYQRRQE